MTAVSEEVGPSGNTDIDALVQGTRWNVNQLSFSFPTDESVYGDAADYGVRHEPGEDFAAVPEELKVAVERALSVFASFANLSFTEIAETASAHADLRFAMADIEASATGYFPSDGNQNGDVWLSTTRNWDGAEVAGSSDFRTILHEVGHALGLSHPEGIAPEHDGWDYTIMAYNAYPGQNLEENNFPEFAQTPMLADVAALQYLYGANFKHNNTDTTYSWSSTTGEMFVNGVGQGEPLNNTIYMTLWDGGGIDTYDFSNYTSNVSVDLRPGEWSSPAFTPENTNRNQVAMLTSASIPVEDRIFARGSIANAFQYNGDPRSLIENAKGGSGNDALIGNSTNNVLIGRDGDDRFFYTGGFDTFHGDRSGDNGDEANFSMFGTGVVIVPTVSTIKLGTQEVRVADDSALADGAGNGYLVDAVYSRDRRVDIAALKGIENLVGTALKDDITGNRGDNIIDAGGGADHVRYLGGYDDIDGGRGVDTIDFSGYRFAISVSLHSSLLVTEAFTRENASFASTAPLKAIAELEGIENAIGTSFDDHLRGNAADNTLDGRGGDDTLFYGSGALRTSGFDTLIGNGGVDTADFSGLRNAISVDLQRTAFGTFEAMTNFTSDVRNYSASKLTAVADLRSIENLTGSLHHDALRGNSAPNKINGLGGDDILTGRGGEDVFVFTRGSGHDVITDFTSEDRIDLSAVVDSLADVELSVQGASTLVRVGADSILLQNVSILTVQSDDFII